MMPTTTTIIRRCGIGGNKDLPGVKSPAWNYLKPQSLAFGGTVKFREGSP